MNTRADLAAAPTASPRRILKFGGTSVTGSERLAVIADVIRQRRAHSHPVIVVSAQSGVTDLLLDASARAAEGRAYDEVVREILARHEAAIVELGLPDSVADDVRTLADGVDRLLRGITLVGECSPRIRDRLLAFGELASARLVASALHHRHEMPAAPIDAADLIVAEIEGGSARVDWAATESRIQAALSSVGGPLPVVTGFLAASDTGVRTTLGRGGSDSSAAILGWALRADAVEIWTDVDGVMTADPRVVADASPIRSLDYSELLDLAHWGAKVVHPDAVRPLRDRGIPLVVRNTARPDDPGTVISSTVEGDPRTVRSIALMSDVATVRMRGGSDGESNGGRVLHALEHAGVRTLAVSQGGSDGSVWVAVPERACERALETLRRAFASDLRSESARGPSEERGLAIVSLVGSSAGSFSETASRVITVLAENDIEVRGLTRGSTASGISCVVDGQDGRFAARLLHDALVVDAGHTDDTLSPQRSTDLGRDVVELATRLVEIPSVTGSEGPVTDALAAILEYDGWGITRQSVGPGRDNLWATRGNGVVTLSTHLDTVPGDVPIRVEAGRLFGRGACDAKGIAAAMVVAANRLADAGEERVDLLFVVGEEGRSDGARAANQLPATSRFLVNGEPTEGHLASGAKGTLQAIVRTSGTEAHSAYPEQGQSAVHTMVRLLGELTQLDLPVDPMLGPTTINVGTVSGGSAPNVLAGSCEATMMVRLVGEPEPVRDLIEQWAGEDAEVSWVSHVPAQRFETVPGFEVGAVGYTTDASLLDAWGRPLLYGPGSIHVAHTPDEHVSVEALRTAVDDYERIVRALLR